MAIQKSRISGPVGVAPTPKVKANALPLQHTEAFEYISSRLIRKHINLSLVLVREDTPLPAAPSPPLEPESPSSPTSSFFSRLSPTQSSSSVSLASSASSATPSWPLSTPSSPVSPRSPRSLFSPRIFSLPSSPLSPRSLFSPRIFSLPSSPLSPRSPTHSMHSTGTSISTIPPLTIPSTPHPVITLLHAIPPTPKAAATLTKILHKASLRFPFRFAVPAAQPTLTHRSLHQNTILFSSEGLTILSLDRIYTLKHALATYSRLLSTGASAPAIALALARALSELRALIFAQSGRPVANTYLQRAYDHLRVSPFALRLVNAAFAALYKGAQVPISGVPEEALRLAAPPTPRERRERESGATVRSCRGPYCRGPVTPGGWGDITPVTRGEWGFVVGGWKGRGAVETC
ncbi:hypothetical protein VC83_05828 [Pseudogymnoascus destructans]|uniref:DUF7582 domain-containing protein n=1 Tax=Pseudogymnoascus destructans TaxID=655981 RepID=A0A177A6L6_9PEZI|nr:uncharacterized protein VC83_05828 [Pseudogymnoascus destructans]OAF57102.1 hypothetical protein VC83_05828 [Pseudogymnoascus destructans]